MALDHGVGDGCLAAAQGTEGSSLPATTADHFVERDGETFAGTHLLIDLWDAARLDDLPYMEDVLRTIVQQCGRPFYICASTASLPTAFPVSRCWRVPRQRPHVAGARLRRL